MRAVYPQEVEDALKADFFGALRDGYFVEVGANEPQRASQTWEFEQRGWRGILVEPQPDLAERLARERNALVIAAACSSPKNDGRRMTLQLAGPHSSMNRMVPGATRYGAIQVPVRTLDAILHQANAPAPIDFVSIDVEGHELDLLHGFDLGRWRPRLILIEDHLARLAVHRHLARAGYRLIRRTGYNSWYVPEAEAPRLGRGHLELLRKLYLSLPFRVARNWKRRLLGQYGFMPVPAHAVCMESARPPCRA
jgi:FkbM family methyltransferase